MVRSQLQIGTKIKIGTGIEVETEEVGGGNSKSRIYLLEYRIGRGGGIGRHATLRW